jgi:uncharacterized protein (TIGR02246 family)
MRKLLMGGALGVVIFSLAGCGGSGVTKAEEQALRKQADMFAIDQLEAKWHKALSTQNVNLMLSLYAQDATWQLGTEVLQGRQQIRDFVVHRFPAFKPGHHWLSDTPAYKIRITANGDKGTLYFECHVVDVKTRELVAVVGGDMTVEKINGHWLIRKHVQNPVVLET